MPIVNGTYKARKITEIIERMVILLKSPTHLGPDIDVGVDSLIGHVLAVCANEIYETSVDVQSYLQLQDVDNTAGKTLEDLCYYTGIVRKAATATTGTIVLKDIKLKVPLLIPVGTLCYFYNSEVGSTTTQATLNPGGEVEVFYEIDYPGAVQVGDGAVQDMGLEGVGVDFEIYNKDTVLGADVEEEEDLLIRRNQDLALGGNGTKVAIQSAIGNIDGVLTYNVVNNNSHKYKYRGIGLEEMPPNSIEVVVEGGSPVGIANAIALTKSSSTEAYGEEHVLVNNEAIGFTRPTEIDFDLHIRYSLYEEEQVLPNLETIMKEAIRTKSVDIQLVGTDVIADRYIGTIYDTSPGIGNITIEASTSYQDKTEDPIEIATTQRATLNKIYVTKDL